MKNTTDYFMDHKTSSVYTLGVASRLSKIPIPSIRQYMERGLIIPFKKESNRHLFSGNAKILIVKNVKSIASQEKIRTLKV